MTDITLHKIFSYLINDNNFLSTVVETNSKEVEEKKSKKKTFNLMQNMITEYMVLAPYETQNYSMFPIQLKSYLNPDYIRVGIKNVLEKDLNIINISFLNSLNVILRPEVYKMDLDEHIKNYNLLESFIIHRIQRNYQIDKTKNTRKVQIANKELIKNISEGKITHDLIQTVINIFEINLLVFDLVKMEMNLYWTKGQIYPYFNLFKDIHFMAYIQGNYEPIIPTNNISEEQKRKIYTYLLSNISEVKCIPDIKIDTISLIYLNSWNIPTDIYIDLIKRFFVKPSIDVDAVCKEIC